MCGHLLARAPVHDQRLRGAEPLGGARHIECCIAAAVDHHTPAQLWLLTRLHAAQYTDRIENARGVARGNLGTLRNVRADGEEGRIETARCHTGFDVIDARVELQGNAQIENALHFGIEHVARQPVLGNAEAHHPAGQRPGFVDRDLMPHACQMERRGKARRPGPDDQDLLAARCRFGLKLPSAPARLVAEEPFDRMDADGFIELPAIARHFARVVADAPHQRGHRIVLCEFAPSPLVVAALGMVKPALDVLARRAGVIARRQPIHIHGPLRAPAAGVVGEARSRVEGNGEGFFHRHLTRSFRDRD